MKKNSEKKIDWKKVAAFGGVFVLGAVAGAIGWDKILTRISLDDFCELGCYITKMADQKAFIRFTITSPKTGRKLSAVARETCGLEISDALSELGVKVSK